MRNLCVHTGTERQSKMLKVRRVHKSIQIKLHYVELRGKLYWCTYTPEALITTSDAVTGAINPFIFLQLLPNSDCQTLRPRITCAIVLLGSTDFLV